MLPVYHNTSEAASFKRRARYVARNWGPRGPNPCQAQNCFVQEEPTLYDPPIAGFSPPPFERIRGAQNVEERHVVVLQFRGGPGK